MKRRTDVQNLSAMFFELCKRRAANVEVPLRSISTTVPKPLGDNSSAGQRKLPAAPLTTISILPKCSIVCATAFSTSSGLRTSAATGNRLAAVLVDRIRRGLQVLHLAAHECDARARFRERACDAARDACSTAGDKRNVSFQNSISKDCLTHIVLSDPRLNCSADRFFKFELSFVQRFANDNTIETRIIRVAQAFDVVET